MSYTASDHFQDWYSIGTKKKEIPTEELDNRRTSIGKIIKNEDLGFWYDLIKISYGVKLESRDNIELFINYFKEVDQNFPLKGNENVIGALAACSVSHLIEANKNNLGEALATAVMSFPFLNRGKKPFVPDLESFAYNFWVDLCIAKRKFGSINTTKAAQTFIKVDQTDHAKFLQSSTPYLTSIAKDLKNLFSLSENVISLNQKTEVLSEELEILWWIIGSYSKEFEKKFSEIKYPGTLIQLTKELAEFTKYEPGIGNIKSFITKSIDQIGIDSSKEIDFYKSINDSDSEILSKVDDNCFLDLTEDMTPCLSAIHHKNNFDVDGTKWDVIAEKKIGIKKGTMIKPLELAHQLYLEMMLNRIVGKIA